MYSSFCYLLVTHFERDSKYKLGETIQKAYPLPIIVRPRKSINVVSLRKEMGISKKKDTIEEKREDPEKEGLASASLPRTRKRKRNATAAPSKAAKSVTDLMAEEEAESVKPSPTKKKATPHKAKDNEKRLRRFRDHAPASYLEKLHRATTQR